MEEPRKTVRALYLGSAEVPRATGMRVLNDALDRLAAARPPSAWRPVAVAVAPSMITITDEGVCRPPSYTGPFKTITRLHGLLNEHFPYREMKTKSRRKKKCFVYFFRV